MRFDRALWLAAIGATLAVAAAVTARSNPRLSPPSAMDPPPKHAVKALKITIVSTMLAEEGRGEWGFSALVEVDGARLLFDTGRFPQTVIENVKALKIDLGNVDELILSHHHGDHTGGVLSLRDEIKAAHPQALARAHVGKGFFWPRRSGQKQNEQNAMIAARPKFEATGGAWIEHDGPTELLPGVYLTGPVPRVHAEKNYGKGVRVQTPSGFKEDDLPEDQSLVFDTDKGLVILSGCGHAGVVNTVEYARKVVRKAHVHALVGGFHLYDASDATLAWTASELGEVGVDDVFGAHCTGLEATYRLRSLLGLSREHCEVAAVGASYSLAHGIDPLTLAK